MLVIHCTFTFIQVHDVLHVYAYKVHVSAYDIRLL